MKRLAAALMVSVTMAHPATAQFSAPTPLPIPTYSQMGPAPAPTRTLPEPSGPPPEFVPQATLGDPIAVPPLRIPTSFPRQHSLSVDQAGCSTCNQAGQCGTCFTCAPYGRFWGEFDYIWWRGRGDDGPALVTTSPAGTATAQAGVLKTPGVRTLAATSGLGDEFRSGLRLNGGVWLNKEQTLGLQAGAFFLGDGNESSTFVSNGDPVLTRPFKNAVTGQPASQLVAFPGVVGGAIGIDHQSSIYGFDAALRGNMCCGCCYRLDALIGYRYLRLEDTLGIGENLVAGASAPNSLGVPTGTNIVVGDRFHTSNTFHGVQVGIAGEYRFWDRWFVSGTGKASLGYIDQASEMSGATTVTVPGQAPVQNVGGLYALSSNIGHTSHWDALIVPEVNANLGYQLSKNLRVRVGYNFLYIGSVARPGSILDTTVNPALIPPATGNPLPVRPAFQEIRPDYFLHGVSGGVEVRF